MKIYVYKMVADNGGAPCVWRGLLSLALCKPAIRRKAEKGDLILGFGGRRHYRERLIYVAWITEGKLEDGTYYHDPRYSKRPDCIYHEVAGKPKRKRNAKYHNKSDERQRDVGRSFEGAQVLLSRDFRYFGHKGTDEYKLSFPAVKRLMERLGQGHRVNHPPKLQAELLELAERMRTGNRGAMRVGRPTDGDCNAVCNR